MSLLVQKRVKAIAEGVAAAFDMEVEVELKQGGYLPVYVRSLKDQVRKSKYPRT